MISKKIYNRLSKSHQLFFVNFKGLLEFMESTGFDFIDANIPRGLGFSAYDKIYINLELENLNDKFLMFTILHEIAHHKRMKRIGLKQLITNMSIVDKDEFKTFVINEEIIADRYARYVYFILNKETFPIYWTQQLHLDTSKIRYDMVINLFHGMVKNSEKTYNKFVKTIVYGSN